MENNVIFFANSIGNARAKLRAMFEFMIESEQLYRAKSNEGIHKEEFDMKSSHTEKRFAGYLENIETIKITKAPTNQFYKVGWADNDKLY